MKKNILILIALFISFNSQLNAQASISGTILNTQNQGISNVRVDLQSSSTNDFTFTDTNGNYTFNNVALNENYLVLPSFDSPNPQAGITTYDIFLFNNMASNLITGIETPPSPFLILGLDMNNSNAVTTFDLVVGRTGLLELIHGDLSGDFGAWSFIDADFVFPDPTNPFATVFPPQIALNQLASSLTGLDFIGLKKGDVSGNATE